MRPMPEIKKVLIANRGEIATRIQKACASLGIQSVQICSLADKEATFATAADQRVCIGNWPIKDSYLNAEKVLQAAKLTGADAVHPGYGFLSENADFADAVEQAGLAFIGPTGEVIRTMGDKIAAKIAMIDAGVPCVPGFEGAMPKDPEELKKTGAKVGYPLIVKAAAGGGGRGMRVVESESDLIEAVQITREEARLAFGDDTVYLEKFLVTPRHVEIQVLADAHGNAVWLGERDCSLQRRHQKVIEESPAPGIAREAIAELGESCAEACRRIGYRGAGTFEFLYENGQFFFIEMNTRIQVEHPVTEAVTGIDLVEAQLRVAKGDPLWFTQNDVTFTGHSIECRLNAEDAETFIPSPGTIDVWEEPKAKGLRIDTHCEAGSEIPPYYDSMIGKIIAHADSREAAIEVLEAALAKFKISGIKTNLALHQQLLSDPVIQRGGMDIHYLEKLLEQGQ